MTSDGAFRWRVEHNDSLARFASDGTVTVFRESRGGSVGDHGGPAWKIVVPAPGSALSCGVNGTKPLWSDSAILVGPNTSQSFASTGAHTTLFINSWMTALDCGQGATRLDAATTHRLNAASGQDELDLDAMRSELERIVSHIGVHNTVSDAIERFDPSQLTDRVPTTLGLSASRTRVLVQQTAGAPLGRVRQWVRLLAAYQQLGQRSLADASALAGFADQPHFTRTSVAMVGRTPGSVH